MWNSKRKQNFNFIKQLPDKDLNIFLKKYTSHAKNMTVLKIQA